MERLKDILAYLVVVGSKPVPFIFAGLVVGLLNEHLEQFTDNIGAIGLTILASSGIALVGLPPLLAIRRKAEARHAGDPNRDEPRVWCVAWVVGIALLTLWLFLYARWS